MQKHVRSAIESVELAIAAGNTEDPPPSLDVAAKLSMALATLRELVVETTGDERLASALAYYAATNTDPIPEVRRERLAQAVELGADDALLRVLCDAVRISRTDTILLPAHRLEGKSRGKGWARKGNRDSAVWGEREEGGYRVGPGKWTVGGNDGFSRKGEATWDVTNIAVGIETWTIAK